MWGGNGKQPKRLVGVGTKKLCGVTEETTDLGQEASVGLPSKAWRRSRGEKQGGAVVVTLARSAFERRMK